jgi:predicted  nucleic acid-binding Zn-ribbon protein
LDDAIKKAATTRQEVDSLKEELSKLKERLKEEEARAAKKDELLRQSALTLLGKLFHTSLLIITLMDSFPYQ